MRQWISLLLLVFLVGYVKAQDVARYKSYHDKGRLLILEGKYEEAVAQLDTAIQIMPYYPTIFQDRGYAKMQLKDYEGAVRDFNHVLEKKPFMNEVRLQRGMALFHLNELDWAEDDLLKVLNATPVKNRETEDYLASIERVRRIQSQEMADQNLILLQSEIERERIRRARYREQVIWSTVVPLAFWTTVFLTW